MAVFRDYVVHTPEEIERIRKAMSMTAQVRDQLVDLIRPGMSTLQIDNLAGELIRATGGTSGFLNYHGFPGNICISLNDEVVHGIPSKRKIKNGDLVVTNNNKVVCIAGVIGDSSTMISQNTKNIALEVALFDGSTIMNSAKRYGIMTVAATNYSKNAVDRYNPLSASDMACDLLIKYADAKVVSIYTSLLQRFGWHSKRQLRKHYITKRITRSVYPFPERICSEQTGIFFQNKI